MDVLHIVLIVLAVAGVWAVVEIALTIRKTRSAVTEITQQVGDITVAANATIEQVQPIISKVDGMVTELGPAVSEVQPMIEKLGTAVDVATVDLASVNDILVDVSSVTDTASNVTSTVSKAANSAVSGVAGVVGKFTAGGKHPRRHKLTGKTAQEESSAEETVAVQQVEVESEPQPSAPTTYFTYGSSSASDSE